MRKTLVLISLALVASFSVSAAPVYEFSYTGLASPFQNALFDLSESSFLTAGTYSISGASLTDGTNTWQFTQLYIAPNGPNGFCIVLATAGLSGASCNGFSTGFAALQGDIITAYFNPGGVPTAPGTFYETGESFYGDTGSGGYTSTTGNATLTITPEPATVVSIGVGLILLGRLFRHRSIRS